MEKLEDYETLGGELKFLLDKKDLEAELQIIKNEFDMLDVAKYRKIKQLLLRKHQAEDSLTQTNLLLEAIKKDKNEGGK